MARARDVELMPGQPFAEAAGRVVGVRVEELFEQAEGVLDTGDIERVHDMRVATRRLRAVLEIFAPCFPADLHRELLGEVKGLADALGERRDPDVHIDALERFAAAVPAPERPGVQSLVEAFRAEQARGNEGLAVALAEAHDSALRDRLHALAALAGVAQ